MPPKRKVQYVCSECRKVTAKERRTIKRKKSAKRVRRGKELAATLPRDERGRFLPRGSVNRFRKSRLEILEEEGPIFPRRGRSRRRGRSVRRQPIAKRSRGL